MNRSKFRVEETDSSNRIISFLLYSGIFVKKGYEKKIIKEMIDYVKKEYYSKNYITLSELRTFHTNKDFNKYVNSLNMLNETPFEHFNDINKSIKTIYKLEILQKVVSFSFSNNYSYGLNHLFQNKNISLLLEKHKDLKIFLKRDSIDYFYIPYSENFRKHYCLKNFINNIPQEELLSIENDIRSFF